MAKPKAPPAAEEPEDEIDEVESNYVTLSFDNDKEFREYEWSFAEGVLILNGEEVSPKGLEYCLGYGIKQTLQDSWSTATKSKDGTRAADYDKAGKLYDARLTAIIEGTLELGTRATNPLAVEINRLATEKVLKAVVRDYKSRKAYEKAKGKGSFAKARKGFVEKNRESLTETAKANIAAASAIDAVVEL